MFTTGPRPGPVCLSGEPEDPVQRHEDIPPLSSLVERSVLLLPDNFRPVWGRGKVNLPRVRACLLDRSNQQRVSDHELVVNCQTVLVSGMEHPQRPDERQTLFHRLPGKLLQQGVDHGLADVPELHLQQLCELVLVLRGRGEEVDLREESGELPPPNEEFLARLGPELTDGAASDRSRVDEGVADNTWTERVIQDVLNS